MASLSAQQNREATNDSFHSYIRHPPHRSTRLQQYHQHHAVEHPTIYPLVFAQSGSGVRADACSSVRGFVQSDGGDSSPDYDNLTPFVRLDRIVEDEADSEDGSINNVHYDNAEARESSDAGDVDGRRVAQVEAGSLDGRGCHSNSHFNNGYKSCRHHYNHHDICGSSVVSDNLPLCELTDKRNTMGNTFTSRTDSVADSSSGSHSIRIKQGKCTLIGSNTGNSADLSTTTASSPVTFDGDNPNIKLAHSSEMALCSSTSDISAKKCVKVSQNQSVDLSIHHQSTYSTLPSHYIDLKPQQQGLYSTVTKETLGGTSSESLRSDERSCAFIIEDIPSDNDTPSENVVRKSYIRSKASDPRTSSKSTSEKDIVITSATKQHTRSFTSTEESCKLEHAVSEPKMCSDKKLLFDHKIGKETGYNQHTPIIVITTSTPKKKPKAPTTTEFADSPGSSSSVPNRDLPHCNDSKKTRRIYKDIKAKRNTNGNHASSVGSRRSSGRQTDEASGSASVDELINLPSSGSYCDLQYIDKDTPEAGVFYGSATVTDQHSSLPEYRNDSFTTNDMTLLPKAEGHQNQSEEDSGLNLSYNVAKTKVTPTASTVMATTKECIPSVSNTAHANGSSPQTVEELKLDSNVDVPFVKSNRKDIQEPDADDSFDYTVTCDVNKEAAVIISQGYYTEVNMDTVYIAKKDTSDSTSRELHDRLIEADSVSLSDPQYSEISEAVGARANKPSLGRFMVDSDKNHYRVVRLQDPSGCNKDASETDAIYAVPIPKSQRRTEQSSSAMAKPSLKPKQLFAEPDSPPKPARSPVCNSESPVVENTDTTCGTPVIINKVQVTCQMKQTTTSGKFYSDSSDYDYSNIPKFGRYDFFSLQRRPKRLRGSALRNSKEVSVSLEMLLKLRHESSADMTVETAADQTVSVDDILRSCREFQQSHAYYRGRTSSDSMQNAYLCSLSFMEMANIRKHMHDTKESDSQKVHQLTTIKRNGIENKQNGTENKQNSALKVNQGPVSSLHLKDTKHGAPSRTENGIDVQSNDATRLNLALASSSGNANISGQNGQMIVATTVLNGSVSGSHAQQKFGSKREFRNTPEPAHSSYDSPLARSTQDVVYNNEAQISPPASSDVKYVSRSDHAMYNCDYDSLERISTPPPSASLKETWSSFSHSTENTPYTDPSAIRYQIRPEDATALYSQRCFPVSSQKPLEISVQEKSEVHFSEVSSARESLQYQSPPQRLASPSAAQYYVVARPKNCQDKRSPQQTTLTVSSGASSATGPAASPMSSPGVVSPVVVSPGVASPASPMSSPGVASPGVVSQASPWSVWSASGDDLSPGTISSGSVDVFSDATMGSRQSSTQKAPLCNSRLEIVEALKWLRAAGFPQYAQMFEDGQFPVDIGMIERDHDFLDQDSLRSLFRRLEKLNKYAGLSLGTLPGQKGVNEEEDEEDLCALSDRWEYKKSARRWYRKGGTSSSRHISAMGSDQNEMTGHSDSHDSLLDQDTDSPVEDLSEAKLDPILQSPEPQSHSHPAPDKHPESFTRRDYLNDAQLSTSATPVASEKNKPSQNVFTKMDVLNSKRSRGMTKRRNIVDISGPIVEDSEHLRSKLERLNCVDISQSSSKTFPRQPSAGGKSSNLNSHDASVARKGNQRSPEYSASHISSQSSPNSHISTESPPNSHIPVQLSPTSHISVHSPSSSHIPVQPSSSNHILVHSSSSSNSPVQSPPFSHISAQSPLSNPLQTSLCASSKTCSIRESRPNETNPSAPPNSAALKQSVIRNRDHISPTYQKPTESDLKLNTRVQNQTAAAQSTSLPPVQSNRHLENAMDNMDMKNVTPPANERHQPGRFPQVLHNGYIETEFLCSEIGAKNNTLHHSTTSVAEGLNPYSSRLHHRNSVYDNIQTDDTQEGRERGRMIFPGIYELENSDSLSATHSKNKIDEFVERGAQSRVEVKQDIVTEHFNSGYNHAGIGHNVSLVSSSVGSCEQTFKSSACDRSVSFETSSLQSPEDSTPRNETGLSPSEATNGVKPGSDSVTLKSKGVVHSSSLDSYFQDSNVVCDIDSREAGESLPRGIAQKEYDDFDFILQQLYQNINELSDYVGKEPDINNSLEFDGALDLDPENSFSGGEGSNTAESSSEDPEVTATDVSRDSLDQISSVSRERRDSGVGHSLPRAPSERRQKKLRWHSFQNSHKPDINCRAMQINHLTVHQMVRLQKLCLLKLTGIMEKCLPVSRSGWNWMMPRFMKKQKTLDFIDRRVFSVPLTVVAQRTGQPLPQCVLYAMRYLRRTSPSAVGIFRKSGVKSKIQQLRDHLETHPETVDFEGVNAYNVADMLKTYFRDLPECLLTNKMSEIFRSIYMHVPPSQRLEAIQTAIVLLPDENREVLQSTLLFLSDISSHEADHQMNASNLAVCFTPTVFQLGPQQTAPHSPKRNRKAPIAVPDPREMMEQKAAQECLLMMIQECKKLFAVIPSLYQQLQVHSLPQDMPIPLLDIGCAPSDVRAFGQERIQIILKEAHDKNRGWLPAYTVGDVEVFHRKPMDNCPLKEWKLIVEIEAPPIEVLHRILHERHVWDEDLLSWSVVERLDPHSDIFQFVLNSMAPHPFRHFCTLRYWRSDLNKGACALITMSVEHSVPMEVQGVWGIDLGSYFLMEHCGSGRSRLTYITRLDTRGRSPEWYTRIFGHVSANFLARLKESFKQVTLGPETRV